MTRPSLFASCAWVLAACGGEPAAPGRDASSIEDAAGGDAEALPDAAPAFRPSPPARDDPRFGVEGVPRWSLIGNAVTAGQAALDVSVAAPDGTSLVGLWLDDEPVRVLDHDGDTFVASVDVGALAPGEHEILLAADWSPTAFARRRFTRTHPLYCFVSTDWDDPNTGDSSLDDQQALHDLHPSLRVTHFVGPYTFTDPDLAPERVDVLVAWLQATRDTHGDEIGLHIHPYCSFVETTSVPCRTTPSVSGELPDPSGYTVVLASYTEDEMAELLLAADELFVAHGLGKPTSFRAGAWTAAIHTLRALETTGYLVDSSAVAWQRLEEWEGLPLYDWNRTNWASIDETSQPYHPSRDDILEAAPPQLDVLEVPDNGALVDYVTGNEMVDIFELNWPGGALPEPRVYAIGYHPPNFGGGLVTRMDVALANVDEFLASDDAGPAVYATASELARLWPR